MKSRPILFSAPMIRALLDGRKTQTRRIIKPDLASAFDEPRGQSDVDAGYPFVETDDGFVSARKLCPYGQPGDLLWGRETWRGVVEISPPNEPLQWGVARYIPDQEYCRRIDYKATQDADGDPWRPSIHMPRWASRLTLRITDVRVERVQDISDKDAKAEGAPRSRFGPDQDGRYYREWRAGFWGLWDSINAANGYGWKENPWVWVIEFEVIQKNIDQVLQEKAA